MNIVKKCANCGHTLKLIEWGPNSICPFCDKNTVNIDIKEVHVIFGDKHLHSFEYFINNESLDTALQRNRTENGFHLAVDYHLVCLFYELCFGNINNPPYSNANYYTHCFKSYRVPLAKKEQAFEKLNSVDNTVPIYLWLSNNEANEYLNLLYFAHTFVRFENVFLVRWNHTETDFDDAKNTMIEALNNKTKLTLKDFNDFSARFNEIQSWNSECIVGNTDVVESWPYVKIEEYVLSCMNNRYRSFGSIYLDVFEAVKKDTSFYISYNLFTEVLHRLMMVGKIKSHGACMWWGDPIYNNLLFSQSFRKASTKTKKYSIEDAIDTICVAFEFGYTYPLYDLLDDSSTLVTENQTAVGRWNIIEYIENDGVYRVHSCGQKVSCDIAKINDTNSHHNNDIYIDACYKNEHSKEHWLIHMLFEDNIIKRLELTKYKDNISSLLKE